MVFEDVLEAFHIAVNFTAEGLDLFDDLIHPALEGYTHAGVLSGQPPQCSDNCNDTGCRESFDHVLEGRSVQISDLGRVVFCDHVAEGGCVVLGRSMLFWAVQERARRG